MKKKRPLSLLEVIIALALSAILLTALFQFFHNYSKSTLQIQAAKAKVLLRQCMHQRLSMELAKVTSGVEGKQTFFQTSIEGVPALVWKTKGEETDPALSGELTHMLYYLKGKGVCFSTQPKAQEQRNEVLFAEASGMAFDFFEEGSKEGWVKTWEKKEEPPAMIKLTLFEGQDQLTFTYILK
jgi:Type II secretory pathway, component PulJ